MSIFKYKGKNYDVDSYGFLVDPDSWDKNFAEGMAVKVNILNKQHESEGIWLALITPEDKKLYYDEESHGEKIRGILLNDSLFFRGGSWGTVINGVTRGDIRPAFYTYKQRRKLKAYREEYPND